MGLPDANAASEDAAQGKNPCIYHQPRIDFKLSVLILCVALFGFFLFTLKIIYSPVIENGDAIFIVKYGIVFILLLVGQFVFLPHSQKASSTET